MTHPLIGRRMVAWIEAGEPRPVAPGQATAAPPPGHVRVRMAVAVWHDGRTSIETEKPYFQTTLAEATIDAHARLGKRAGHVVHAMIDLPLPPPVPEVVGSVSDG